MDPDFILSPSYACLGLPAKLENGLATSPLLALSEVVGTLIASSASAQHVRATPAYIVVPSVYIVSFRTSTGELLMGIPSGIPYQGIHCRETHGKGSLWAYIM